MAEQSKWIVARQQSHRHLIMLQGHRLLLRILHVCVLYDKLFGY